MINQMITNTSSQKLQQYLSIFCAALGLGVLSQITIPLLGPVPVTLQTAAVVLIGMHLGSRIGVATILAYFMMGLCGLPVFSGLHFGLPWLLGPTGGYILGFLPAVWLSGLLVQTAWGKTYFGALIIGFVATVVMFVFGMSWLATMVGWQQAYLIGLAPFFLPGLAKLLMIMALAPRK